jgi:cytochrome c oxidase subunit 2
MGLMKMHRWQFFKRLAALLSVAVLMVTAGCSLRGEGPTPLNPKGTAGEELLWLIYLSLGIMIIVLVVVFALFFYVIIRFRRRKGDTGIPQQVEGNHKLEIVWTVIPIILLLILAVPTVALTFSQAQGEEPDEGALLIKVKAHQFWWEFEYPELGIYTAQDLWIPVNRKINLELTSADVAHSFWVPGLAGKMDTIPGLINRMELDAKEEGIYKGKCAELCGASHALMDFKVVAVSEEEFADWAEKMKAPAAAVTDDTARGQEIFAAKCMACHAVDATTPSAGPNLKGFADRITVAAFRPNTEEWIKKWLDNPDAVKQGATMPQVELTDEEIDELTKYLQSLKRDQ